MAMRKTDGFSIMEVLAAMAISVFLLLVLLATYSKANAVKSRVQGTVKIQNNVRLAMDRMVRDLRMTGFAVPRGLQIGGSSTWTPAIFHASPAEIAFRADLDGGSAEIICTPRSSNVACPLNVLRLDSLSYYAGLDCSPPDGTAGPLRLIASLNRGTWEPLTCQGYDAGESSIAISGVADGTFKGGKSRVATIEQVYYRFVPASQPPYGSLIRAVRYDNLPDDTFPPSAANWTTVAHHLTDFWLQFKDRNGGTLSGWPLSTTDRKAVRKVVLFMEGYDRAGPTGRPQLIRARTEIAIRNPV